MDCHHEDDAALITRSVADPQLFAGVYERYGLKVRHYVARRVGQDHGDDLTSEVFVQAFRARERYRPERSVALPWLLGIANHVIADHRRLERRRLLSLQRVGIEPFAVDAQSHDGLGSELAVALRGLPARERDTLLIVVWGELSLEEASVALGVPIGTVSSRLARARKRLTSVLAPECGRAMTDLQPPQGKSHV